MSSPTRKVLDCNWPSVCCDVQRLGPATSAEICCLPCAELQPDHSDADSEQPSRERPDSGDEARSDEAAGSGSEDDLMVVKRRDALEVAADVAAQHAHAALGALGEGECNCVVHTRSAVLLVTVRFHSPDRVWCTRVPELYVAS